MLRLGVYYTRQCGEQYNYQEVEGQENFPGDLSAMVRTHLSTTT